MNNFERLENAMFDLSMPCNPLPFLLGLADYVKQNGTDSIKSDTAKRMLWIVQAQAYGSTADISLSDQWAALQIKTEVK